MINCYIERGHINFFLETIICEYKLKISDILSTFINHDFKIYNKIDNTELTINYLPEKLKFLYKFSNTDYYIDKYLNYILINTVKCDNICSICLDPTQKSYNFKCGHYFHNKCIITWIERHDTCPICRQKLYIK